MPNKLAHSKEQKPAPKPISYEQIMAAKLLPIYRRWVADGRPSK